MATPRPPSSGASASASASAVHVNPRFAARPARPTGTAGPASHWNPQQRQQLSHPSLAHLAPSAATSSHSAVHVNPRFANSVANLRQLHQGQQIHYNPRFQQRDQRSTTTQGEAKGVHINPNFSPRKAHVNPNFIAVDQSEKDKFEAVIKAKTLQVAMKQRQQQPTKPQRKSMFVNPNFYETAPKAPPVVAHVIEPSKGPQSTPSTATPSTASNEKENHHHHMRNMMKFIRKPTSATPRKAGKVSPIYKKIGSKKLIRMKTPSRRRSSPHTPLSKVRKRSSFVKTPLSTRKIIHKMMTPLTLRRNRKTTKTTISKEPNPFKVDHRPPPPPISTIPKRRPIQSTQILPPPKPARTSLVAKSQVIHIEGVKFAVSEHGRQLRRVVEPAPVAGFTPATGGSAPSAVPQRGAPIRCSVSRKLFLDGDEFVENDAGVLIRSRNSMTRASITSARNKSIHTLIKSQTRSKQYCMFFNKFGKCNKREKGVCPYLHDPSKVAVCRRFLMGSCHNDKCLLSHKVAPEKMPSCKFFLEGLCTKGDECPYRHVKVNADAEVCQSFLRGHCEAGSECKQRHVMLCPAFEQKGFCPKGSRCPWPHIKHGEGSAKGRTTRAAGKKTAAPVKPKRKSISKPDASSLPNVTETNRRYYQEQEVAKEGNEEDERRNQEDGNCIAEKRQRLLCKIESSKKSLAAIPPPSSPLAPLTTSSGSSKASTTRPPMGTLPQFIPLSQDSSSETEDEPVYATIGKNGPATSNKSSEQEQEIDERLI